MSVLIKLTPEQKQLQNIRKKYKTYLKKKDTEREKRLNDDPRKHLDIYIDQKRLDK